MIKMKITCYHFKKKIMKYYRFFLQSSPQACLLTFLNFVSFFLISDNSCKILYMYLYSLINFFKWRAIPYVIQLFKCERIFGFYSWGEMLSLAHHCSYLKCKVCTFITEILKNCETVTTIVDYCTCSEVLNQNWFSVY